MSLRSSILGTDGTVGGPSGAPLSPSVESSRLKALGNISGLTAVSFAEPATFTATLTGATEIEPTGLPSSPPRSYLLKVTTAGFTLAIKGISWIGSEPTLGNGTYAISLVVIGGVLYGLPGLAGPAGAAGTNGNTVRTGSAAPVEALGAEGDFYIRSGAVPLLYGPKASGTWPAGVPVAGSGLGPALSAHSQAQAPGVLLETATFTPEFAATNKVPNPVVIAAASASEVVNVKAPWLYQSAQVGANSSKYVAPLSPTEEGKRVVNANCPWQIVFDYDGENLGFSWAGASSGLIRIRIWANDVVATKYVEATQAAEYFCLIPFGSREKRRIIIECDFGFYLKALIREKTATITPPSNASSLVLAIVGDSYSRGYGINASEQYSAQAYSFTLARFLGCSNFVVCGRAGSGYLNSVAKAANYRQRVGDLIATGANLVFIQSSINDAAYTEAELITQITEYIAEVRVGLPRALLIASSPIPVNSTNRTANATNAAACKSAYAALGIPYIDAYGGEWITGNGTTAATTGEGNSDYYASNKPANHPSAAGHVYIAKALAAGVANSLGLGL
jgi:lysophospholipase L1-like esterase